jgi:hopene-associated glycosyltransferase HpnB
VVDDGSTDGTAEAAQLAAARSGRTEQVTVVRGLPLLAGWTGKLWAMAQGVARADALEPDFLLFTDADVQHGETTIAELVTTARAGDFHMASYMVKLACRSRAEELLIPAFVYFFFMLYPPDWTRSSRRPTAGAAGGCVLLRPEALRRAGGLAAIRNEIIDDCALARIVKRAGGRVWLGLTQESFSLRGYNSLMDIMRMISRTAFKQLRHSTLLLIATLLGLLLVYVSPVCLILSGRPIWAGMGLLAWMLMSASYFPMTQFYGESPVWCLSLPLAAVIYAGATVQSAIHYWFGRGGEWKGRTQDRPQ